MNKGKTGKKEKRTVNQTLKTGGYKMWAEMKNREKK